MTLSSGVISTEHADFHSESYYSLLPCKVKVKLSLCLTKHHAMNTCGGVEVQLHVFLTSALD